MSTFNKLAARKELGAIAYRLNEPGLEGKLCGRIIGRHIANLVETLPPETFGEILLALRAANKLGDIDEIHAGVLLLQSLIPTTYGSAPAGTVFRVRAGGLLATKRKDGIDVQGGGLHLAYHLDSDQIVILENI